MLGVVVEVALQEQEFEKAHAPAYDRHVLELILEHDLNVTGALSMARGLPNVPPVGINLMIRNDNRRTSEIRWQFAPKVLTEQKSQERFPMGQQNREQNARDDNVGFRETR
jgi:hypothetical protein